MAKSRFGRPLILGLVGLALTNGLATLGLAQEFTIRKSVLTPEERDAVLKEHNDARREVGVEPLEWSEELSEFAFDWLEESSEGYSSDLLRGQPLNLKHRPRNGEFAQKYGENMSYWGGSGTVNTDPARAVKGWYAEKAAFDKLNAEKPYVVGDEEGKTDDQGRRVVVGHYTQMVWKATTQVGAAKWVMTYTDNRGTMRTAVVIVANYDPQGNFTGEAPY